MADRNVRVRRGARGSPGGGNGTGPTKSLAARSAGSRWDGGLSKEARLFLLVACVWPLLLLGLFVHSTNETAQQAEEKLKEALRKRRQVLRKRVNRLWSAWHGKAPYGPLRPRVAVVVEGEAALVGGTVESVFRQTERERILLICAVVDEGGGSDGDGVRRQLEAMDQAEAKKGGKRKVPRGHLGKRVHVVGRPNGEPAAQSRQDCVDMIDILARKHERAGLKSADEDILLLLLRAGVELASNGWLDPVTAALIVPHPLLDESLEVAVGDAPRSAKLANAVTLALEDGGQVLPVGQMATFDRSLRPKLGAASAKDWADAGGEQAPAYASPALSGAATAMRLATFLDLPGRDLLLQSRTAADLELALNLWLCGDGIDVLTDARVLLASPSVLAAADSDVQSLARIVAAWADDRYSEILRKAIAKASSDHKGSDVRRMANEALSSGTTPAKLGQKCRSFSWYADNVNLELSGRTTTADAPPFGQMLGAPARGMIKNGLPSRALSEQQLQIVQKAEPVALAFQDVSASNSEHPHKGARDENGVFGYVHDATALRRDPPTFVLDDPDEMCRKGPGDYKMLTEKVFVDLDAHNKAEKKMASNRVKIFCVVYTIPKNHFKLSAIRETWGSKCDGFMVASTETDKSLGTVDIPHEGKEEYENIWQKVRSIWSYIYDNYYTDYDYFHIGGDDLYIIVENLRLYLESDEIRTAANGGTHMPSGNEDHQVPLFMGRRFAEQGNMNRIFNSGGSGYTLNKASLKALVVNGFPNCMPHLRTFAEDVMVAQCLRNMNIFPYDTKDEKGGERYMPFRPGHHLTYRPPKNKDSDWYAKYSIDIKYGLDHCSAQSVAFHYIPPDIMKRMHAILYGYCQDTD